MATVDFNAITDAQFQQMQKEWIAAHPGGSMWEYFTDLRALNPQSFDAYAAAHNMPFRLGDNGKVEFDSYGTKKSWTDTRDFLPVVFGGIASGGGIASNGTNLPGTSNASAPKDIPLSQLGNVGSSTGSGISSGLRWASILAPIIGGGVGSYLQSSALSDSSAMQERLANQAIEYAKSQDALAQQNLETRRATESARYGDYSGRIAPYLATGASANDRMARLLGLGA